MNQPETGCAEPDAPWVPCAACGKPVKTCERAEPVGPLNDYTCPAHPDGCEVSDGRFVCSFECWEKLTL